MGNVHGHSGRRKPPTGDTFSRGDATPNSSPGSPLTYGPQVAMEPIVRPDNSVSSTEFATVSGWGPAQPKLVPTVIVWSHGGNHVEVEGSFDNWSVRQPLQRSGRDFTIIKLLPPGVYQYKFIVDGKWQYDPNQPAMYDEMGNVNNVIEVQEYLPENLDSISGFEPPPSPDASYATPESAAEDFQKEPPTMPQHLNLTLLNVPPAMDAQAVLPRPQHVILNHAYVQRATECQGAIAIGVTTRYRSKYITTVIYQPRRPAAADGAAVHPQ